MRRIAPKPIRLTLRPPSRQVPAAPAGTCDDLALDGTAPLGSHGDRGIAGRARLRLGESAVRGAEAQGEGQGLAALADLGAGVDVEEAHRLEQVAGTLAQRVLDGPRAASAASTTRATSSLATGKVEKSGPETVSGV